VLVDVIILAKLAGYIFFPYPSIDLLFNAGGMSYSPSKIKNNRKKRFLFSFCFFPNVNVGSWRHSFLIIRVDSFITSMLVNTLLLSYSHLDHIQLLFTFQDKKTNGQWIERLTVLVLLIIILMIISIHTQSPDINTLNEE
jgi:hypothetical protein